MWSGRLPQPLNREFELWQRSFPFDQRLLEEELAASRAHARALHQAGVLSAAELAQVLRGLESVNAPKVPDSPENADVEDVHHFVEKSLVTTIGDVGYKLPSGRSRNEQIATDLRLYVRRRIDELHSLLAGWIEVLLARAAEAGDAPMPAYTHLQPAEPVLVAHWLLAYAEMFFRDHERLADCRRHANLCPLGSGAVAGTLLALDRRAMAAELGFAAPTANSLDATCDRDFAIEFVQALSLLAVHMSRWAEETILFCTREFRFLRLPDAFSTGSSAMPQKQNPDALELIRGQAGRLIGDATALLVTVKGLPLAYNKDLQETQQPLFSAADAGAGMLTMAAGLMRELVFDYDRMRSAAQSGFMNAMAAAHYLVSCGVPFRLAHEQIGRAVQACLAKNCELQDLPLQELRQINPKFAEDFYPCLALESVLALHDVPGGTAPARVQQGLAEAQSRLAALRGGDRAHA
jgi:argininosuccinate lyase